MTIVRSRVGPPGTMPWATASRRPHDRAALRPQVVRGALPECGRSAPQAYAPRRHHAGCCSQARRRRAAREFSDRTHCLTPYVSAASKQSAACIPNRIFTQARSECRFRDYANSDQPVSRVRDRGRCRRTVRRHKSSALGSIRRLRSLHGMAACIGRQIPAYRVSGPLATPVQFLVPAPHLATQSSKSSLYDLAQGHVER
jgi:hypothetical protein